MIRLVNLGHCLLYRRKGLPFIILKPVQREPERRDNGRRIVSLSGWSENRDDRYDNASFRESGVPFPFHMAKVTRFYPLHKDLNAQEFSFLGDESLRRFLFRSMIV